jgi:UDPglucose--hexose-1-phosphate uridylyltransferase
LIKQEQGIEKACEYFYTLSVKNNYVQKTAISKNLKWEYKDGDKYLEITINLSKPEKDNKEIAKLLTAPKKGKYPACLLCKENEGFQGTLTHPARENIRTISLKMGGEDWFVQYSPYAYYDEHMIAISNKHTPMHIQGDTIDKILDFVDFFPNYMIGSNAALPIIGGSILNHEHFQGGVHLMPMHNAPIKKEYSSILYPSVKVGIVNWYNSVIRLQSENRSDIRALAVDIIKAWETFNCPECEILSNTGEVKHNSLAPVARKKGNTYILDIILRNNRADSTYPDGIFHAHPEYHNIKKEGIGLIEAMGLFILPGRLQKECSAIKDILTGKTPLDFKAISESNHPLNKHFDMIVQMTASYGTALKEEQAGDIITEYINATCEKILDCTAVFKNNEKGQEHFKRFVESVVYSD